MRPTVVPQALNGQPFQTVDALALGVSWKMLQGSRFRRLTRVSTLRRPRLTRTGSMSEPSC
jgi:hypothetical protein